MKKTFEEPKVSIMSFAAEDVVTASAVFPEFQLPEPGPNETPYG